MNNEMTPESKAIDRLLTMLEQERRSRQIADETLKAMKLNFYLKGKALRDLPAWRQWVLKLMGPKE
jgi:hypothetical protein